MSSRRRRVKNRLYKSKSRIGIHSVLHIVLSLDMCMEQSTIPQGAERSIAMLLSVDNGLNPRATRFNCPLFEHYHYHFNDQHQPIRLQDVEGVVPTGQLPKWPLSNINPHKSANTSASSSFPSLRRGSTITRLCPSPDEWTDLAISCPDV